MDQHANVDALNDVIKTMIDSCKGYEKACELADDSHVLQSQFQQRASERRQLITEMQQKVRSLGADPTDDGGTMGAVHRGFTDFTSMFRDDEKAALSAVDDGEDHLIEEIESKLEREELTPDVRDLLQRAHASAKKGERFADRMDD